MFTCFCIKCGKVIDEDKIDYEVELAEGPWDGDWEHVHLKCGGAVSWN